MNWNPFNLFGPSHEFDKLFEGLTTVGHLKPAPVEYVLIYASGCEPEETAARVGAVVDCCLEQGAMVFDILGSLIVAAYGPFPGMQKGAGSRATLVVTLHQKFNTQVKVLHGSASAHYGNIGSASRCCYSLLIPEFDLLLGRLAQLDYGQCEAARARD